MGYIKQLSIPEDIDLVNLNKLKEIIGTKIYWYPNYIELKDVCNMINDVEEVNKQYQDWSEKSKEWHIGRIKYFVNNPNKITPITVDDGCNGDIKILDGCHRYLAKLYLEHKTIECFYSGLVSNLEWLKDV